ncbi:DNA-directed RNA polymerase IV subunit 1 [Fagus crenata]
MDIDLYEEKQVPSGFFTSISFNISTYTDTVKQSEAIKAVTEVTDPKLGLPNPFSKCLTCGAKDLRCCEGHFGVIKLPFTILHPCFLLEAVKILNKICLRCKSIRHKRQGNSTERCPTLKFKVSSEKFFRRSAIIVEAKERLPNDFWDFILEDEQQEESNLKPNKRFLSHAQDDWTRAYKKLVSFRGTANELGSCVMKRLKFSKASFTAFISSKNNSTDPSGSFGLRWIKDVAVGKRSDHCFRMVVVGDPHIKLSEIGIPCDITERLQISERLNRPLNDGDIVLINRPPSIHQNSLIALSVKVLPVTSVLAINPLCCSPFRGDFDDRQVINGQNGRNLLSLSQDSLTAAHLVMEDGVLLNLFQMQQLQMFCPYQVQLPAIVKAPSLDSSIWTGKQLFSMLLPSGFDYDFPSNGVHVSNGELLSSEGSFWLCDNNNSNLFQSLVKHCRGKVLDFLHVAQEVLCEWLSMQGLSVSLSDLYLSSDSCSRKNMMHKIFFGLQEAKQMCNFKQLMVDSCLDFLVEGGEENFVVRDVEHLCYEKQKFIALCQASVDAFKQAFREIQNLVYTYASKDNSLLAMLKAGSRGNLLKLSLVPLSFRIPHQLSCAAWNNQKAHGSVQKAHDTPEHAGSYVPYAVVENSFLTGLNPLECFVHSNADVPGTLNRRLMFLMRDLYTTYDGTVRNVYFSYNINEDTSTPYSSTYDLFGESVDSCDALGGKPVGSLSASAISEVACSALDQPISLLETSPLLNLKKFDLERKNNVSEDFYNIYVRRTLNRSLQNLLECGSRKCNADKTWSIFLSEDLGRQRHGFEYGTLALKNHLERKIFSDIVSTVMIIFSPQTCRKTCFSPWVCHFHICTILQSIFFYIYTIPDEIAKRRGLDVHSIINSLQKRCNSSRTKAKLNLPNLIYTGFFLVDSYYVSAVFTDFLV